MTEAHDITLLLNRIQSGDANATNDLMVKVYNDLQRMAASQLHHYFGKQAGQITLEPAALVNESFLRLIKQRKGFDNRGQFFALATRIMLRVLIDYRREKFALKRGADAAITLSLSDEDLEHDHALASAPNKSVDIEALAAALDKLETLSPRKAEIVKMRVIWNMTVLEIAATLEISTSSVDRDWKFAKVWIAEEAGIVEP